ncbi:MAG TPA: hypothetical protein VHG89_11520 [Verrucomicrobiae bacterium]|nr:hypothetical protein [Verrucomicrobiae bacterium]
MRNIFIKSILSSLLGLGLFGSITALFIIFCVLLPNIKSLMAPNAKMDPIILAAVYKWITISVISAALAGGILILSIVSFWFDLKKWWKETSSTNPSVVRRHLVVGVIIVILTLILVTISFMAGKNGW